MPGGHYRVEVQHRDHPGAPCDRVWHASVTADSPAEALDAAGPYLVLNHSQGFAVAPEPEPEPEPAEPEACPEVSKGRPCRKAPGHDGKHAYK